MARRLRYEVEQHVISIHENDLDAHFKVRRNGKVFYIQISPSRFINSPSTMERYLTYLEVLKSGEEVLNDMYDTDVYDWAMPPFEPFFAHFAPSPVEPANIRITLQEHLFPKFFVFNLDVIDEEPHPRLIPTKESPYQPSSVRFHDNFLDELEIWTALYDPAGITVSYNPPEDALFKSPRKVLINNDQTECFFKPCYSSVEAVEELKAYKKIHAASLSHLNLCHLHGVVMDDCGFILGILLTYIDCDDLSLSAKVHPDEPYDPPPAIREKWMGQIESIVSALHQKGIVWGDAKAANVLIDRNNNAWVTDFGAGYTEGWVAKNNAGTVLGDLTGLSKLRQMLFPSHTMEVT